MAINNKLMEGDKECSILLNDIMKELTIAKDQSIEIANKLYTQTGQLENTSEQLDTIDHEADISRWHINHIRSTFGKVYKKIHSYPIKQKAKLVINELKLKSKLNQYNIQNISNKTLSSNELPKDMVTKSPTVDGMVKRNYIPKENMLDKISSTITDIHYINKLNQEEIDKQNILLDNNINKTDNSDDKIFSNTLHIKKILS
jgi:hypothetical protein